MSETQALYAKLETWNTPQILDAAMTCMIAEHDYEAVLTVIERKLEEEARQAISDGVYGYGNSLIAVGRHIEAAVGTLAFTSKRKPHERAIR